MITDAHHAMAYGWLASLTLWPNELRRTFEWVAPAAFEMLAGTVAREDAPTIEVMESAVDSIVAMRTHVTALTPEMPDVARKATGEWLRRIDEHIGRDLYAALY